MWVLISSAFTGISHRNACEGTSNEYPQHTFKWRTKKKKYPKIIIIQVLRMFPWKNIPWNRKLTRALYFLVVQKWGWFFGGRVAGIHGLKCHTKIHELLSLNKWCFKFEHLVESGTCVEMEISNWTLCKCMVNLG